MRSGIRNLPRRQRPAGPSERARASHASGRGGAPKNVLKSPPAGLCGPDLVLAIACAQSSAAWAQPPFDFMIALPTEPMADHSPAHKPGTIRPPGSLVICESEEYSPSPQRVTRSRPLARPCGPLPPRQIPNTASQAVLVSSIKAWRRGCQGLASPQGIRVLPNCCWLVRWREN